MRREIKRIISDFFKTSIIISILNEPMKVKPFNNYKIINIHLYLIFWTMSLYNCKSWINSHQQKNKNKKKRHENYVDTGHRKKKMSRHKTKWHEKKKNSFNVHLLSLVVSLHWIYNWAYQSIKWLRNFNF